MNRARNSVKKEDLLFEYIIIWDTDRRILLAIRKY